MSAPLPINLRKRAIEAYLSEEGAYPQMTTRIRISTASITRYTAMITALTLMGCGQDVVVEPKPVCGDGVCATKDGEQPGDAYGGCLSDCGSSRWYAPDPDTEPLQGLRLFSAGGVEVPWPSPLAAHTSCGPLTGGW